MIKKSDFDFNLPDDSIAKYPLGVRDQSKLLVYKEGKTSHHSFQDISSFLDSDTLLVMNNAKVIPARLYFNRLSGAKIEVLLLEPVLPASYEESFNTTESCRWKCIIGNSKKWKDDETVFLSDNTDLLRAKLVSREERIVELTWDGGDTFTKLLDKIGELPLPPYLNRSTEEKDYKTYQTVFAKNEGSVAAPTAGLHFTEEVFNNLSIKGIKTSEVTLHVGAGTFLPVKDDNVVDHKMHREYFEVTLEGINELLSTPNRVAVGTTSLRVLESLYWIGLQLSRGETSLLVEKLEPYEHEATMTYKQALKSIEAYLCEKERKALFAATEILILPHYSPKSIVGLVTNFHLPESTLLMLIASIVGTSWREVYEEALANEYRFLSYGDSSLLFL